MAKQVNIVKYVIEQNKKRIEQKKNTRLVKELLSFDF